MSSTNYTVCSCGMIIRSGFDNGYFITVNEIIKEFEAHERGVGKQIFGNCDAR